MKERPQIGFNLHSTSISAQHKNGSKRQMKKMNYPFEQFLSFDDKQIEMESANQTRRFYWESIETVCEDDKHWFLGHDGLVIEKELLTKEQLEFVKKKCDAIKNHNKWM